MCIKNYINAIYTCQMNETIDLTPKSITYEHQPPPIEWHITYDATEFSLMNVSA